MGGGIFYGSVLADLEEGSCPPPPPPSGDGGGGGQTDGLPLGNLQLHTYAAVGSGGSTICRQVT
jgi:hypothetical protein